MWGGGAPGTYSFTVTNDVGSGNWIDYIKITAPTGFTITGNLVCPEDTDLNYDWTSTSTASYVICSTSGHPLNTLPLSAEEIGIISFTATAPSSVDETRQYTIYTEDTVYGSDSNTAGVTIDSTPPTISSITTKDTDGDGAVETATILFSEPVDDSTFAAGGFTIGGSTASTINTGTADDNTFDIVLTTGVSGTEAKDVTYTQGTGADLVGNLLANVVSGGVTEIDGANPILLSAQTTSVTTIDLTFSEDLLGTTVTNVDFSVDGYTLGNPDAYEVSAGVVRLTVTSAFGTGDTPHVSYIGGVKDLKDNVAPIAGIIPSDGVAPTVLSTQTTSIVSILVTFSEPMSAVLNTDFTVAGNTISSVTFTASETTATLNLGTPIGTGDTPAVGTIETPTGTKDNAAIPNLIDGGLSSTPSDGVAPVFVSATATSNTNIDIVFSEPVSIVGSPTWSTAVTATGLTATGGSVSGSTLSVTVDSLGNTAYTASNLAIVAGTVKDTSNNQNDATSGKAITDGQAPTFVSAKYTSDTNLQVTFSEALSATDYTKFTSSDFTATAATVNAGDNTKVDVTINNLGNTAATSTDLDIAADAVTDTASNINIETLDNSITDGQAPTMVSTETISTSEIGVTFSEPMSAVLNTDFTVAGNTISSVTFTASETTATLNLGTPIGTGDTPAVGTIETPTGTKDNAVTPNLIAGSLSSTPSDGVAPTVTSVSSTTADGAYNAGQTIVVTVTFSENVDVTGTPQILLETGTTDRQASYASGTGTNTLTFDYTVQSGDTSSDLDYVATDSLTLNSGTIKDVAGNDATLTLATPGDANSLGANKNIVIDTTAPTFTSVAVSDPDEYYKAGDTISFNVNLGESGLTVIVDLTVLDTALSPTFTLTDDGDGTYSGTTSALSAGTMVEGIDTAVTLTATDTAGNEKIDSSLTLTIDKTAPTVSIEYSPASPVKAGAVTITATYYEAIVGTPQISIDQQGTTDISNADMTSGDQTVWTYTYTVNTANGVEYVDGTATVTLSTVADSAGNNAGTPTGTTFTIDTTAPTITSRTPGINAVGVDATANVTVGFSENVACSGAWASCITLSDGGSVSGTPTYAGSTLTFDPTAPLTSNTEFTVTLTGITDLAGNSLSGTLSWTFTTATYYSMGITNGWNSVSIPTVPVDESIAAVLGDAEDVIDSVWTYDAVSDKWYMYAPGDPSSDLDTMTAGYGYWISATGDATIDGYGSLFIEGQTPPQRQLAGGWNLIGYYQNDGVDSIGVKYALSTLADNYCDQTKKWWTSLVGYDNTGKSFTTKFWSNNMAPGEAFWIFMKSSYITYKYGPGESSASCPP